MLKKFLYLAGVTVLALLFGSVGQAGAVPITFNFNSPYLPLGSDSTAISAYMTAIYGSTVTVTGAASSVNPAWTGNSTQYIRTAAFAEGDFELSFDVKPILSIQAGSRGFIFNETIGSDFSLTAFNSNFTANGGTRENPNYLGALVTPIFTANPGAGTELVFPDIIFSEPVTLLVISDSKVFDVGIDDLSVTPIPEPSTILLLTIGLAGIAGYAKTQFRRKKQ